MKELILKRVKDYWYPQNRQLLGTFFVSDINMSRKEFEVRPLLLRHIIYYLARNNARLIYWHFIRALYDMGFIDIDEGEAFHWDKFTWHFNRTLNKRYRFKLERDLFFMKQRMEQSK